ncbi:MAG: hypothetical protein IPK04_10020 [Bdellovibrionales bacterium]|nr:hypothetical protein [Bdellovibrionales bacterium]
MLKTQVDRDHIGKGGLVGKYSGFTLHGGVAVGPGQRDKLEKLWQRKSKESSVLIIIGSFS